MGIYWCGECSAKSFSEEKLKEIFKKYTEEIYKKIGNNIPKRIILKNDPKLKKSKY